MKRILERLMGRRASVGPVNLCQAPAGRKLIIRHVPHDTETACRLQEMGFCESAVVRKLSATGNLICQVCGARVALSRELAEQVIVEEADAHPQPC